MSLSMDAVRQAAETPLVPAQICTKASLKCTLRWKGVNKKLHCIYSIFIFGLVSKNIYIFNIRIWSGTYEQIYSIFVFGQVLRNKYIRYSYSVSCLDMNIFDIRIRWKFHFRIYSYSYSVKNLIFVLHWSIFSYLFWKQNSVWGDH